MKTKEHKAEQGHKCSRFRTVRKEHGIRETVACRECGLTRPAQEGINTRFAAARAKAETEVAAALAAMAEEDRAKAENAAAIDPVPVESGQAVNINVNETVVVKEES